VGTNGTYLKMNKTEVSIITPADNEDQTIGDAIQELR
jgi:hypothetical protein